MNLTDFISKYNAQPVDFDGAYGPQCMDLMHRYIVDVLGYEGSLFAAPTAYQAYQNANDPRFDKISNTPTGVPQKGDIIFWNTSVGSAGHVAIFISGDVNGFTSFDQNWPVGSPCHQQAHNYNGVAGWLHPKEQSSDALASCMTDRQKFWQERDAAQSQVATLQETVSHLNSTINDKNTQIASLQSNVDSLTSQLNDAQSKYQTAQEQAVKVPDLEKQLEQAIKDRTAAWDETDQVKKISSKTIAEKDAEIAKLTSSAPSAMYQWLIGIFKRGGESA